MAKRDRVPTEALVATGLKLLEQAGVSVHRQKQGGSARIYKTEGGKTVRMRTSNDRLLIVQAESERQDARLNVEGTDHVLIVMPNLQREYGPVIAYFVPTDIVVDAIRTSHREWLASNPNTKGNNRTWNIWFDHGGPPMCNGFAEKWERYRLPGEATIEPVANTG